MIETARSTERMAAALGLLRGCALFGDMDETELARVARLLRIRYLRPNEVVFQPGDPGDFVFVVGSGSVKIVLGSTEGEEAIIAEHGPGDFFGELSALDGAERSAAAVALEPAELGCLERAVFLELVETQPGLRRALLAGLAAELRGLTRHVEELHFLDLPGRLAVRLVELARRAGGSGRGARLPWHYTQADLAAMIGGSRQSVSQLMSDLSATGLVRLERDILVIPDIEALERVAQR